MRRFLHLLIWAAGLLVAAVLLSPYWLGFALPAIARPLRARVGTYSRIGYTRFVLENVTVERRTVTIQVKRAEADTPWLWALRHLLHRDHLILADDWKVVVHAGGKTSGAREAEGWVPLQEHLSRIANGLESWLRLASIGRGEVEWPRNQISLAHAGWHGRKITVEKLQWRDYAADVDLLFERDPSQWQLSARGSTPTVAITAEANGPHLKGQVNILEQTALLSAGFSPEGWLPATAEMQAEHWTLPAEKLHLQGYQEVRGSARASWAENRFVVSADVASRPNADTKLPPLAAAISAQGDQSRYEVSKLEISMPGIQAHLDHPIAGDFQGTEQLAGGQSAKFTLQAHLPDLPGLNATGDVQAVVDVQPKGKAWPLLQFTATGKTVVWQEFHLSEMNVAGRLDWPRLTLTRADLATSATSKIQATGEVDFSAKQLQALRVTGYLDPELFKPWLPATVGLRGAQVSLLANGPFDALTHQGSVRLDGLKVDQLQPALVQLGWQGRGTVVSEYRLGIQMGHTEISAEGSGDRDELKFAQLVWRQGGQDRLKLQSPARLIWRPELKLEGLNLLGEAGELRASAAWGEKGSVTLFARGIDAAWWQDLLPLAPFDWSIANLYVNANWDHGPAFVDTAGQMVVNIPNRAPITVNVAAKANGKNVELERLQAAEEQTELANFTGEFPLQLFAGKNAHVIIDRQGPLKLNGQLNKDAPEWTELAKKLGAVLSRPEVVVTLSGSLEEPQGSLEFSAAQVELDSRFGRKSWPKIENLHAQIKGTGKRIDLVSGGLTFGGQAIDFSGELPLNEKVWSQLRTAPWEVLRSSATLKAHIPGADLTELAPFLSPSLQPQGHLAADVSLAGRGAWRGYLRFNNLATKPLGSLGRLRDIHGEIDLEGRNLVVKDFQVGFGERPIKIGGTVNLPPEGAPRIELTATGNDLPFVRQAGLLVRGNVRLTLSSAARKSLRPIIRGDIELTDGLFVSDVRALVPRGGSGPELRPPYFSVETEPIKDWRLDVEVHGEKFLRARTTVFTGTTSMRFHLDGTLFEPRALGELRLNDGQVMFPFAQFSLNDATIRLTEANPYDPILGIFGKSRRYGYDLTMDVTGNASAPVIAFSANPTLTSEQVLLMVMAGDVPKDEISYSTTQKISRLGTFFGQSLLGSLGGGAGQDRLSITSGQEVSITGRETYDVEYALDNRWSLVGEYDQFDDYNAGVKWKILAKPKHDADEKK